MSKTRSKSDINKSTTGDTKNDKNEETKQTSNS